MKGAASQANHNNAQRLFKVLPNIWATSSEYPFGGSITETKAFLIQRAKSRGNAWVYSSSRVGNYIDHVRELGGVSRQLLNHRDEASSYCNVLGRHVQAPVFCHQSEKEAIEAKGCDVGATFRGYRKHRELGGDDLIAYHTPGHTEGATSYLFRNEGNSDDMEADGTATTVLFTGDTIYTNQEGKFDHGPLQFHPYLRNKEDMIKTLQFYITLNPTYIICGLSQQENGFVRKFDAEALHEIIEKIKESGVMILEEDTGDNSKEEIQYIDPISKHPSSKSIES